MTEIRASKLAHLPPCRTGEKIPNSINITKLMWIISNYYMQWMNRKYIINIGVYKNNTTVHFIFLFIICYL